MTRLGALAEGVKEGVAREKTGADRVLSLLRERFEDEGEGGTCSDWDEAMFASVFRPRPSLALRRRARSLCSLNSGRSAAHEAAASGNGGTTKWEGGIVTVLGRWGRAARGVIGWPWCFCKAMRWTGQDTRMQSHARVFCYTAHLAVSGRGGGVVGLQLRARARCVRWTPFKFPGP